MKQHRTIRFYQILLLTFLFPMAVAQCSDGQKSISGSGTIEVDEIRIAPLLPARIQEMKVGEGDHVSTGQTLVLLSSDEVRAAVSMTSAGVEAAAQNVQQAEASYRNASRDLQRAKELFQAGSIPAQKLDGARTRADVARAALQAARAQMKQVNAGLSQARSRLDETTLLSPIDGVVLRKNFLVGEVVMPGSAVLTLANLNQAYLKIYVPEAELTNIQIGQKARISVDGLDQPVPAHVSYIANEAEFTPKNVQTKDARTRLVFEVKLSVNNANGQLKPGMPADGEILYDSHPANKNSDD
ncbi:MAG: efflux RND transporter periplasmic adaptor subunit [Leptospiraceae bacterium]|nr:efflux RND transporter periplasmic adaptor subunit [Leptospiraceae bacterium]